MDIELVEGDGNFLAVKGELYLLLHIIECIPVVAAVTPGEADYVNGTCGVFFYCDYWCGILEDEVASVNNLCDNLLCSGEILII